MARSKKALATGAQPLQRLRSVVRCPTQRYNIRVRGAFIVKFGSGKGEDWTRKKIWRRGDYKGGQTWRVDGRGMLVYRWRNLGGVLAEF